jgi:hypothetical protein
MPKNQRRTPLRAWRDAADLSECHHAIRPGAAVSGKKTSQEPDCHENNYDAGKNDWISVTHVEELMPDKAANSLPWAPKY